VVVVGVRIVSVSGVALGVVEGFDDRSYQKQFEGLLRC
jgi:hypothetical protein